MSRFVVPKRLAAGLAAAPPEPPDGPGGRLVKYIPGEILAIYTSLVGVLLSLAERPGPRGTLILIGVFTAGTLLFFLLKAPKGPVRTAHMVVSPLAFLAWAYPISSGLLGDWFRPVAAVVAQGVIALLAFIIGPTEK